MKFKKLPTGYAATFEHEHGELEFVFKHIKVKSDSVTGILVIRGTHLDTRYKLYVGRFNALASRTRKELANYIKGMEDNALARAVDIQPFLEKFSQAVIEDIFSTEPPIQIQPVEDVKVHFALEPIAVLNQPALIFAPGGSGKSFLAMYFSLLVQNGIPLDMEKEVKQGNVLYIDWETNVEEAQRRFTMLRDSFEDPSGLKYPLYKHAVMPLHVELDDILHIINDYQVSFIVIDSAAPAVGGDINSADSVITFFQALRHITTLGVTPLIITHIAKAEKRLKEPTPVGSVFFENLSRITWELRYEKKEDHVYDFLLIPRKTNYGIRDSLAFRATFAFGGVRFEQIAVEESEANKKDYAEQLLLAAFEEHGQLTVKQIADITGLRKDEIASLLAAWKEEGIVELKEGKWQLADVIIL